MRNSKFPPRPRRKFKGGGGEFYIRQETIITQSNSAGKLNVKSRVLVGGEEEEDPQWHRAKMRKERGAGAASGASGGGRGGRKLLFTTGGNGRMWCTSRFEKRGLSLDPRQVRNPDSLPGRRDPPRSLTPSRSQEKTVALGRDARPKAAHPPPVFSSALKTLKSLAIDRQAYVGVCGI